MNQYIAFTIITFSVAITAGCGGAQIAQLDETQLVVATVTAVNDAAGDQAAFQSIFVGTAPENREAYFSSSIEMVDEPEVDGNTASVNVRISQGGSEDEGRGKLKSESVVEGETTWTLIKEGDYWKIQDAPLPEV